MTTPAIRLVTTKTSTPLLHLHCHIKPSVSAIRSGIQNITDNFVNINVSAQPRNGESNKAVRELIAGVLGVPKTDVEIVKGLKSREKVVAVVGVKFDGGIQKVEEVRKRLLGVDD